MPRSSVIVPVYRLLFLESDDTLTPGALEAIADRLAETGDPDVPVFDSARAHGDCRLVRDQLAAQLTERGPAPPARARSPLATVEQPPGPLPVTGGR
ncbi:hypothetical protein ACH4NF_21340 [Streptomyces sp. NPDC017248]|uniref:hypothetical protein n=1 Tax=unclassified Streptomyces TaxID=2593676 RepID=UPI003791E08F